MVVSLTIFCIFKCFPSIQKEELILKNNRILLQLLFLSFSCAVFGQLEPEKENPPFDLAKHRSNYELAYPGDSSFDVTYYRLDLTITNDPDFVQGIVTVQGEFPSQQPDSIFLDLSDDLTVSSIVSRDGRALTFSHQEGKLYIPEPALTTDPTRFDLDIHYSGLPDPENETFHFVEHAGEPAIFTLSEPYGASTWWPCKDTPGDKADSSDVLITCDPYFIPVSNGTLESVTENGSTHTYHWKNHYPIAQYLISIAMANYDKRVQYFHYSQSDSMPVEHYFFPEDAENSWPDAQQTVQMLTVFTDLFGPYPFLNEKYGHAQMKAAHVAGMEHQTITSMNNFAPALIAHELAHQWFGDKITCSDWHHIWVNEGFATYCEALYWEQTEGTDSFNARIESLMSYAKGDNVTGSIYIENLQSASKIFSYAKTYAKGALVLHMLRGLTGDSLFFDIMKTYATDPDLAYGNASIEDFQRVAEYVSGMELSRFFSDWLYGENYPVYRYAWYTYKKKSDYWLNLTVRQVPNTEPVFFTMPVDIKIKTEGPDTLITVENIAPFKEITIALPYQPLAVILNPENRIICSAQDTTSEGLTQGDPSALYLGQNYPNPFSRETNILYSTPVQGQVRLTIFNSQGQQVATLLNETQGPGWKTVNWNGKTDSGDKLPSGLYVYQLELGNLKETQKMLYVR